MRIITTDNYEDLSLKAAFIVGAQVFLKPDSAIGFATGSTPVGLYQKLIEWYRCGLLDFSGIRTWNLDEYLGLGRSENQSYWYFMHKNLFDHINVPDTSIHFLDGKNTNPDQECKRYDKSIKASGGIDLQILGLGHDGHIGFNEPGSYFSSGTHPVRIASSTIKANARFFSSEKEVPREAYTMGIGSIMSCRKILLLVSGADKAKVLQQVLYGPITPQVPGSILQLHQDVVVIADRAALESV